MTLPNNSTCLVSVKNMHPRGMNSEFDYATKFVIDLIPLGEISNYNKIGLHGEVVKIIL